MATNSSCRSTTAMIPWIGGEFGIHPPFFIARKIFTPNWRVSQSPALSKMV
jgi:hypothetical protein